MKRVIIPLVVVYIMLVSACTHNSTSIVLNEIVMREGMAISAINNIGTMTIKAGSVFKRYYTWDGDTRSVNMWPRKERWHGSYGLYYPGPGNHWKEHDGITRLIAEEGVLQFDSEKSMLLYLNGYSDRRNLVYSDDGLCVYWDKNPGAGGTLTVLLWQLLINGEKPTKIPGSQNDRIKVSYD